MKKALALAVILASIALVACGALDGGRKSKNTGFEGTWKVEGQEYTASLKIKKIEDGYALEWDMPGGVKYYGAGLEVSGVLGAVYVGEEDVGVVAYKLSDNGISGLWTTPAGEELDYEKTRGAAMLELTDSDLEGVYDLDGKNFDGSGYSGTLELVENGETYAVRWLTGSDTTGVYGAGFVVDDVLVVGYGDDEGSGIAVYRIRGSVLNGMWTYGTYENFIGIESISRSTETATKQRY